MVDSELSTNMDTIRTLIESGEVLLQALEDEYNSRKPKVNFRNNYLTWYVLSRKAIKEKEGDLLEEFDRLYSERSRPELNEGTYCIRDYILITTMPPSLRKCLGAIKIYSNPSDFHPTYMRLSSQIQLLKACTATIEDLNFRVNTK